MGIIYEIVHVFHRYLPTNYPLSCLRQQLTVRRKQNNEYHQYVLKDQLENGKPAHYHNQS